MNYNLNTLPENNTKKKTKSFKLLKSLVSHMVEEKRILLVAFIAMFVTAILKPYRPHNDWLHHR